MQACCASFDRVTRSVAHAVALGGHMNLTNLLRLGAPACAALVLAACGGSSKNASPGSVIVEVPVPVGGDDDDEDDEGDDDDSGSQDPVDETTVATVIPSALEGVISNSGESAGAAFGNKPIYTIDVSETSALDPAGLGARQRCHLRDRRRGRPHYRARWRSYEQRWRIAGMPTRHGTRRGDRGRFQHRLPDHRAGLCADGGRHR